jgi:hypothetical protein
MLLGKAEGLKSGKIRDEEGKIGGRKLGKGYRKNICKNP